jgi:hypothetical protein
MTATLPAILVLPLHLSQRQKLALYTVFAVSYLAVVVGALRTYASYHLFFETYDVTWAACDIWLWSLLELHIGCMCANAPACKAFWMHYARMYRQASTRSSTPSLWEKVSFWKKEKWQSSGYLSGSHVSKQGAIVAQRQEDRDVEMGRLRASTHASVVGSDLHALPPVPASCFAWAGRLLREPKL